jgi:hypothetical protein
LLPTILCSSVSTREALTPHRRSASNLGAFS